MADYSNAEKLLAVVDYWSKPMVAQLPPRLAMLAPVLMPVLGNMLARIPDEAIPQAAKAIVDSAVQQGVVTVSNIRLSYDDLTSLQRLLELNLPCDAVKHSGYDVIVG